MNTIHLTIHFPSGAIDPMDLFWVLFRCDVRAITEAYQDLERITARDAWPIAKTFGKAAENSFDVCPTKRKCYLVLSVNGCYSGGHEGMWEELFDDGDVQLSYEVKPTPGEVADAA